MFGNSVNSDKTLLYRTAFQLTGPDADNGRVWTPTSTVESSGDCEFIDGVLSQITDGLRHTTHVSLCLPVGISFNVKLDDVRHLVVVVRN